MNVMYASKAFLALTVAIFLFGCDSVTSLFKADPGKQASVIVQQQLNSPSSFKYMSSEVLWKGKSKNGEPAYVVSVVYDAQNSFGAMLRGCMLVSFYETSDNKVGWNPMFGVRDGNEYAACDPSPSATVLKVKIATVWAEANSFVAQDTSSPAPTTSTPAKPAVATSATPAAPLPKFVARCTRDNNISFLYVTDPSQNFIYFAREDHQFDASRSTDIRVREQVIEAATKTPCCENSLERLDFNRQTGDLLSTFIDSKEDKITHRASAKCERLDDSSYEVALTEIRAHYARNEEKARAKKAEEQAKIDSAKAEEQAKIDSAKAAEQKARNAPNKF